MDFNRELLGTMAVVAAGAMLGRIQFRGIRLDMAAMLLVGVLAAHFGIMLSPALGLFGLLLFLYTVGVGAGPALRGLQRGDLWLGLAGIGVLGGLLATHTIVGRLLGLPLGLTLGAAAGFFSSGAALAVIERSWLGGEAAAGFALAAPLASLLVMLLVHFGHTLIRGRAGAEIAAWNEEIHRRDAPAVQARIRVEQPEAIGRSLRELRLPCQVLWLRRGGAQVPPKANVTIQNHDLLRVAGSEEGLIEAAGRLGSLIRGAGRHHTRDPVVRQFFVSNPGAIGVPLHVFAMRTRYGATITRIRRSGVHLTPGPNLRLRWGDRVQASTPAERLGALKQLFGDDTLSLERFAFPRAALVIFVGGSLGAIPFNVGGFDGVRLGSAFGVLFLSLITSLLHRTGPLIWSQTERARRLMAQIGLPLFLVEIGNASYGGLLQAWVDHGYRLPLLTLTGVAFLLLAALLVGRLLRLGPLATLSVVPAAALNTPAFDALQERHQERIPAAVYAAIYPVLGVVLLISFLVVSIVLG